MTGHSLSDMARAARDLIGQAKILCPEFIPDPKLPLNDQTIIQLLLEVVHHSRFPEYFAQAPISFLEVSIQDELEWLASAAKKRSTSGNLLPIFQETIDLIGLDFFSQIQIWTHVFDWDELHYCLDNEFLPFSLILFAPYHLDGADFDRIHRAIFGFENSGAGVLAAAISPFLKFEYAAEIYHWQHESETIRGMEKFPLTAFLLDDFGLPGVGQEVFTGQMSRNSPVITLPWSRVPSLFPELDVMETSNSICRKHLPMQAPWLVSQIINTLVLEEEPE